MTIDKDTLFDIRQALTLLGDYIGNEWAGGSGVLPFDRIALIEKINADFALHDPGKTSTPTSTTSTDASQPAEPAPPEPATREYNVMLRRSCFEYISVGMAGISAQNVVDTIREHLKDSSFIGNLPWERDTEKSEPVDWISAEGELELGERGGNDGRSIDHAEWEQPKPGKLMEALIAIRRLSSADSDNLAMLQDALSAIADVANKIVIDHVEGEAGKS